MVAGNNKMGTRNLAARFLVATALFGLSLAPAHAGLILTNETAFNNAVAAAGLGVLWSEDFEAFASGPLPFPATDIAGGSAVVRAGGFGTTRSIEEGGATGKYYQRSNASAPGPIIEGPLLGDLGVRALSFFVSNSSGGLWDFVHSAGSDSAAIGANTVSSPQFIGWVGVGVGGPEFLSNASFGESGFATLDNVTGYGTAAAVPAPATGLLAGFGIIGMAGLGLRRTVKGA